MSIGNWTLIHHDRRAERLTIGFLGQGSAVETKMQPHKALSRLLTFAATLLLAAPLATHVGWSLRASGYAEGDLFTIQGSMIPFAQTEVQRLQAGDLRPSLESRYASRDAWVAQLTEAVDRLVADRLLLAEDGDRLTAAARETWDVYQEL